MTWLRMVSHELFGLFVDDGQFAIAIVVWLAGIWLVLPHFACDATWAGALLSVGLAAILIESARRQAKAHR